MESNFIRFSFVDKRHEDVLRPRYIVYMPELNGKLSNGIAVKISLFELEKWENLWRTSKTITVLTRFKPRKCQMN